MSQFNESKLDETNESNVFSQLTGLNFELGNRQERHGSLRQLRQYWINERGTPELQEYQEVLVETTQQNIELQQKVISEMRNTGNTLLCNLYQMELDRANYILASYLRTRLKKIEKHALGIYNEPSMKAKLSKAEFEFTRDYIDMIAAHFSNSFLNSIPENFRELIPSRFEQEANMIEVPDLEEHVFVRVKQELEIGDQAKILHKNDLIGISYIMAREMIETDRVELV